MCCVRVSFSHVQNSYKRHQYPRFHNEHVCEIMSSPTFLGGIHFFVRGTHVYYHQFSHNNDDYGSKNMSSAIFCCRIHFEICRTQDFAMNSSTKSMNTSAKIWVRPTYNVELPFKKWIRLHIYEFCNFYMQNSFWLVQHSLYFAEYGSLFCEYGSHKVEYGVVLTNTSPTIVSPLFQNVES